MENWQRISTDNGGFDSRMKVHGGWIFKHLEAAYGVTSEGYTVDSS